MLNLLGCSKDNFKKLLQKMNYKIFDKDDDDICRWMTKDKATISELLYDRGYLTGLLAQLMIENPQIRSEIINRVKKKSGG